jgi:site-specific DNA-adenine methylase
MKHKTRRFEAIKTLFGDFQLPKIRTYRIPYVGSKNVIAPQIIEAILSNTVDHGSRRFVDAFCGGGAIMYGVMQTKMFASILGNDLHSEMIELHRNLPDLDLQYIAETPCILLPNATVKEKYPFVKLIDEIEPRYQMAFRVVYSFGNDCRTNLWGSEMIVKYNLGRLLFTQPELMGAAISEFIGADLVIPYNYTGIGFSALYTDYKTHVGLYRNRLGKLPRTDLQQLQQLERLQQLEQLQQLERLQRLERLERSIDFSSVSYHQIAYMRGDVVYFDPPYRSTLDGKGYHGQGFDNDSFEDFARSLKCPVFISEYAPEIEGFEPIMKLDKLSTMNNKGSSKETKQRTEYLHWNGVR